MGYKAIMWVHGRVIRIIVRSDYIVDMDDSWNNRASAEAWVYAQYGSDCRIHFETTFDKIKELDQEWLRCANGD